MPSQEYCEGLLKEENAELKEAQRALDALNKAIDDVASAFDAVVAAELKAAGYTAASVLDPAVWADVSAEVIEGLKSDRDFQRALKEAGRARENWDIEEEEREAKFQQWCEECGEREEPEDLDDLLEMGSGKVDYIFFSDDEGEVIVGYPSGEQW